MTARAPGKRGFTLTEALVALFVFGLVASLLLSVIDMETRVDHADAARTGALDEVVNAQTLLRARIEGLRALPDLQGNGKSLAIGGTGTALTFIAPAFDARGPHALQQFRLALSPQRDLTLYSASTLSGIDMRVASTEGWEPVRLTGPVDWLQITYFGRDRISGRAMWQDGWQNRADAPQLVRVRVGFAAGDAHRWPVFIVRPGSTQETPCEENDRRPQCGTEAS